MLFNTPHSTFPTRPQSSAVFTSACKSINNLYVKSRKKKIAPRSANFTGHAARGFRCTTEIIHPSIHHANSTQKSSRSLEEKKPGVGTELRNNSCRRRTGGDFQHEGTTASLETQDASRALLKFRQQVRAVARLVAHVSR